MSDDLKSLLRREPAEISQAEVDALLEGGRGLVPALTAIVEDEAAWEDAAGPGWAAVHAYLWLGSIRAPGTLEVLMRALDRAYAHEIDLVTDAAPNLLSGFGAESVPLLAGAAADPARTLSARIDFAIALGWAAQRDPGTLGDAAAALRRLAGRPDAEPEFRRAAAAILLDFARPEDRDFLEALEGEGGFDPDEIEDAYAYGPEDPPELDDWLDLYGEGPEEEADVDLEELAAQRDLLAPLDGLAPAEGPLRSDPKVGRNDPCPCGSGKKFKKCCGA
jgi:hypothetical protein